MTHLTRTTQHGLFSTTVAERPNRETGNDHPMPMANREPPFAVSVDMTPDECRRLRAANYPEYDWPSVSNLSPRTRGKHY
jgi:hypothetical protein